MGQPLNENDFYAIILGSLPASYDPYISAVNATSSVLGKTISADDLMLTVTEEYERRNLKNKRTIMQPFTLTTPRKERREALARVQRKRTSCVITVTRKVIISLIVGLRAEGRKVKDRSKRERGSQRQTIARKKLAVRQLRLPKVKGRRRKRKMSRRHGRL